MKNIIIFGYPKCGNTWIGYLLSYYFNSPYYDIGIEENLLSGKSYNFKHFYTYNHNGFLGEHKRKDQKKEIRSILKSHSPPDSLLNNFPKFLAKQSYNKSDHVILITRDPKDVSVSYFYHHFFCLPRISKGSGNIVVGYRFLPIICQNLLYRSIYCLPYNLKHFFCKLLYFNRYVLHVARQWTNFNNEIFHFDPLIVHYENLHLDTVGEIERISKSLNLQFFPKYAEEAKKNCEFSNLKKRQQHVNSEAGIITKHSNEEFYRSGKIGSWRDYFSSPLKKRFDQITGNVAEHLGYI